LFFQLVFSFQLQHARFKIVTRYALLQQPAVGLLEKKSKIAAQVKLAAASAFNKL
jgi:hypothetical protein